MPCRRRRTNPTQILSSPCIRRRARSAIASPLASDARRGLASNTPSVLSRATPGGDRVGSPRPSLPDMASADLLRREEEFYSSLFDPAKGDGDGVRSRSQVIERKIEALEDMATKVSNRRSRRWLNDRLLIELVPRLHVEEIKGLFAPPPWGEELPLSAFCRTSVSEWEAFRSIDMDAEARLMQHMNKSSEKQRTHVDEDELIALNAWRRIDRQTRDSIKRNFLPDLLEIYEERVRSFIEDAGDSDVLVLNVQDPFQRLLLHAVCEFYNVTSATTSSVRDGKPWKSTTIKKRLGTGVPSRITLVSFLRMKKNGSQ
ncbi:hypothetical protein BS78_08G004300 [Paspalum vaginatum]|nr:hypothetical protein BS78_08G004300 [Paspalum vaginatum]